MVSVRFQDDCGFQSANRSRQWCHGYPVQLLDSRISREHQHRPPSQRFRQIGPPHFTLANWHLVVLRPRSTAYPADLHGKRAREGGVDDARLQYSTEWCFFTRCQWGEFDTALYELERAWGRKPEAATPIGGGQRAPTDRTIHTLDDVHAAVAHYVDNLPYDLILSTAAGVSTDIDYRLVSDAEMAAALSRRAQAGPTERDIYASYINELFLTGLEKRAERIVYQFSLGAEPLPFETGSRLAQRTIGQLGEIIARHPRLRFQCFLSSRHANQSLCTLARELPNFSLVGYWWHNFFPDIIRQVIAERLDMLPVNKQVGFFSDAYCVEWTYGKALLARKQMARVLADKIELGQYTRDEALAIAKAILFETPQTALGMVPYTAEAS